MLSNVLFGSNVTCKDKSELYHGLKSEITLPKLLKFRDFIG